MPPTDSAAVHPLAAPLEDVAHVPRRFGVGVMMILVTVFAVLFAVLNLLGVPPGVFAIVTLVFLGVTAAQILLFGGQRPRQASLLAGGVLLPLGIIAYVAIAEAGSHDYSRTVMGAVVGCLLCGVPGGAVCGYAAGNLMAGVFLILDWLRRPTDRPLPPQLELRPCTADDLTAVLAWVANARLRREWALGEDLPATRENFAARLARAAAPEPELLCFAAVERETHELLGYVELVNIDRVHRNARIWLPIVNPAAAQRGALSMALLEATVRYAFKHLHLHRLEALALWVDDGAVACYSRAGFHNEGRLRESRFTPHGYDSPEILSLLSFEWILRGVRKVTVAEPAEPPKPECPGPID